MKLFAERYEMTQDIQYINLVNELEKLIKIINRIENSNSDHNNIDNIIKEYENCSVVNFNLQFYKRILKTLNIDPKTICKK